MLARRPQGLTLLELVVVIAILVVLMVLLIPALQSARSPARRTICATNLKNLALAAVEHEFTHGALPGYLQSFGTFPGGADPSEPRGQQYTVGAHAKIGTWAITLMPNLGAQTTYEHWTEDKYPLLSSVTIVDGAYNRRAVPKLPIFICPQSDHEGKDVAAHIYVANCGLTGTASLSLTEASKRANGAFNNQYDGPSMLGDKTPVGPSVRIDDFKDGTGNTLCCLPRTCKHSHGIVLASSRCVRIGRCRWYCSARTSSWSPSLPSIIRLSCGTPTTRSGCTRTRRRRRS